MKESSENWPTYSQTVLGLVVIKQNHMLFGIESYCL